MNTVYVLTTGETAFSIQIVAFLSTLVFLKRPRLALKLLCSPPGCLTLAAPDLHLKC